MDIPYDFFDPENKIAPGRGKILISEPFLHDSYFKRSIVLITEHSEEGTIGFVLNKPINLRVDEVIEGFPFTSSIVCMGGPVNTNTIHYIHTLGDIIPNSVNVTGNIFWGGDFDAVRQLTSSGNLHQDNIRFFLGYSGWQPNQLVNELTDNAWVVAEIDPSEIMAPMNNKKWKTTLQRLGKKLEMWAEFPDNPQMN